MAEVNHVNIASCSPDGFTFAPIDTTFYSLYLYPTHGFQWDIEVVGKDLEFGGTSNV